MKKFNQGLPKLVEVQRDLINELGHIFELHLATLVVKVKGHIAQRLVTKDIDLCGKKPTTQSFTKG